MNVIVTGNIGSGKSTAIRRILAMLDEPVYGFWTEKRPPEADGSAPVYLHGCRSPLQFGESCRIGICRDRHAEANPTVFESLGVACLTGIPRGSLILMDEIGVMENRAPQFQTAIFALLDGDYRGAPEERLHLRAGDARAGVPAPRRKAAGRRINRKYGAASLICPGRE